MMAQNLSCKLQGPMPGNDILNQFVITEDKWANSDCEEEADGFAYMVFKLGQDFANSKILKEKNKLSQY